MEAQRPAPGVQRTEQADLGTEIFLIGQQLLQRLRRCLEQAIATPASVVVPQSIELVGEREDHVIVIAGQQPALDLFQPLIGPGTMASGATAMSAGMVLLFGMIIVETLPLLVAEFFTLAFHDRLGGLVLIHAQTRVLFIRVKPGSEYVL